MFGPYAQDDDYGSRVINPMELYHNQVTREQQGFSLRMFHRSWGIMLIQENLETPCDLLDFPSRERFIEQLKQQAYDVVGITSIVMNIGKVKEMCRLVRQHLPKATIIVGGHIANLDELGSRIDVDHVVKGEGVRWMQEFLGEDTTQPIRHPKIVSGLNTRILGMNVRNKKDEQTAVLLPSVGCPVGCNFCSTSTMFGGKGHFINFFETGDELFQVMQKLETEMHVQSFFIMDENFLLHRKRALRLLELLKEHEKSWQLYVFSSARVLRSYTLDQLVELGIAWVWMGLEGEDSKYSKLRGVDTKKLVRSLQSHGICVLGSTIIGMEEHTPHNIDAAIDHAVAHDTEFQQFMLYTPIPGTPLYEEHKNKGTLLGPEDSSEADIHGQFKFNFRHPNIKGGLETEFLLRAFRRDFEVNGPSITRMARTLLQGWQRYKQHPERRIRRRFAWQSRDLATTYAGILWASIRWFKTHPMKSDTKQTQKMTSLLKEIYREFGLKSRISAPVIGRFVRLMLRKEQRRLQDGWTYEPPTFFEAVSPKKQA